MAYQNERTLHQNWKLCLMDDTCVTEEITSFALTQGTPITASVPGDWVLDYVREGLLPEPYVRDNYLKVRDYENHHIFYATSFEYSGETENTYLRFEGIDTVADIYLNGVKIGHAENMYIAHEFEAVSLCQGTNELMVHIYPVALEARKYPVGAFEFSQKYNYESLVIRKAAHMFGWDICPRIVSAGLWREVKLITKKPSRLENVFMYLTNLEATGTSAGTDTGTGADTGAGTGKGTETGVTAEACITFDVEIGREPVEPYTFVLKGKCGEHIFETQQKLWYIHGRLQLKIPDVQLWWPRGYGEANLYEMTAELRKNGEVVDTLSWKQGLRTAELIHDDVMTEDGEGDFCFVINKKRIYIKGTNWVPADAFHSNDVNRIPEILKLVKDIGCNAMRVWGGGVYENDYFYDWCDENGIVLWQDFMMACGIYPHTERMQSQLREEACHIVRRLRHHASICLWAGDNECDQSYCWHTCAQDPTRNVLTRRILPEVLHAEDISRPYIASSPYVSQKAYEMGKVYDTPEQHLWGPRDYFKGHFYHDATAVFASEMGYHGCNSPESIYRFIPKEEAWPVVGNPQYLYHAASPETEANAPYVYRIPLMTRQLHTLFGDGEPQNLDTYARMSQISQAEAKKFFVECFRARRDKRTGLIWWNIMDCWPQISDAVVDYYFCKKLAYSFIRRSQQPVCLMMDDNTGELILYGVNDTMENETVRYRVYNVDTGETWTEGINVLLSETSTPLYKISVSASETTFFGIEWTLASSGEKFSNHYLHGEPPYTYDWYMSCLKKLGFDEFEGF